MSEESVTLPRVLAATVAARGASQAFVAPGENRTWRSLAAGAAEIARALQASGIDKGDHVGVMLGNGARWLEIFFACASVGAGHGANQHPLQDRRAQLLPETGRREALVLRRYISWNRLHRAIELRGSQR